MQAMQWNPHGNNAPEDRMPLPEQVTLAMAYVPFQPWEQPLAAEEALEAGTVFPSLVKPFLMGKGGEGCGMEATAVFRHNGKG